MFNNLEQGAVNPGNSEFLTNEGRKEFCSILPHIPITTRPSHFHLFRIADVGNARKFIMIGLGRDSKNLLEKFTVLATHVFNISKELIFAPTDKYIERQVYNINGDRQNMLFDQLGRSIIRYCQNAKNVSDVIKVRSTYFSSAAGLNHIVATSNPRSFSALTDVN